jgi:hypothetical protein
MRDGHERFLHWPHALTMPPAASPGVLASAGMDTLTEARSKHPSQEDNLGLRRDHCAGPSVPPSGGTVEGTRGPLVGQSRRNWGSKPQAGRAVTGSRIDLTPDRSPALSRLVPFNSLLEGHTGGTWDSLPTVTPGGGLARRCRVLSMRQHLSDLSLPQTLTSQFQGTSILGHLEQEALAGCLVRDVLGAAAHAMQCLAQGRLTCLGVSLGQACLC